MATEFSHDQRTTRRIKHTRTTIETEEHLVVRLLEESVSNSWCEGCRQEVGWIELPLTTDESALPLRGGEGLHVLAPGNGRMLICKDSLAALIRSQTTVVKPARS